MKKSKPKKKLKLDKKKITKIDKDKNEENKDIKNPTTNQNTGRTLTADQQAGDGYE